MYVSDTDVNTLTDYDNIIKNRWQYFTLEVGARTTTGYVQRRKGLEITRKNTYEMFETSRLSRKRNSTHQFI